MPLKLDAAAWRAIFPRAPKRVIDAFAANQGALDAAGITATKTRLAYALANVEHECGGFTIPNLTENINYTAERMAKVWPNRFKSAAEVKKRYGTGKGWQLKAFDDIYGGRMGNRKGTSDGSRHIGRGGPQITGRDGYREVGKRAGLDLENKPELASAPEHQPAILAAFWSWKNLNRYADAGDFLGCVKAWNGGTNGLADRQAQMKGNEPIIERLKLVDKVAGKVAEAPAKPVEAPHGQQSDEIRDVQIVLDKLGYHEVGTIDGKWGGRTAGAIAAYKNDRGMVGDPVIDQALTDQLLKDSKAGWKRPISEKRAEATSEEVQKEAPELVPVRRSKFGALWTAIVSGVLGFISAVADYFQDALGWVVGLKSYAADAPGWLWFALAGGLAGIMYLLARNGAQGIVEAFRKGERS